MILNTIKLAFTMFAVFFAPIQSLVLLISFAVILDTIVGVYKSWKLGQPILSRKLSRVVVKTIFYSLCIILIFSIEQIFLHDIINGVWKWFLHSDLTVAHPVTKLMTFILICIEMYSIDENVRAINGKGFWFYYGVIISKIRKVKGDMYSINDKPSDKEEASQI